MDPSEPTSIFFSHLCQCEERVWLVWKRRVGINKDRESSLKDNEDAETCSVVSDAPGPSPVRCWHVVTLSHVASSCRKHLNSHNVEENRYSSLESLARSFASPSDIAVAVEDVNVFLWLLLWFWWGKGWTVTHSIKEIDALELEGRKHWKKHILVQLQQVILISQSALPG